MNSIKVYIEEDLGPVYSLVKVGKYTNIEAKKVIDLPLELWINYQIAEAAWGSWQNVIEDLLKAQK